MRCAHDSCVAAGRAKSYSQARFGAGVGNQLDRFRHTNRAYFKPLIFTDIRNILSLHGLRISEAADLRWDDVHLDRAEIHVRRLKGSKSTMQPIEGDELRALRKLRRDTPTSPFLFVSEQGGPMCPDAIQYMLRRAGEAAGFPMHVHHHMLRHGCGHHLITAGANTRLVQEILGHRDIRNTQIYTELDASRFRGLWRRSG